MTSNLKPSETQSLIRIGLFIVVLGIAIPTVKHFADAATEPEKQPYIPHKDFTPTMEEYSKQFENNRKAP
jgi:uncharacterized membrane protein